MPQMEPRLADWRQYFAGRWRMARRIEDRRDARTGAATGEASFLDVGGEVLACSETLAIDYGGRRIDGEQRMLWRFGETGPVLHFHDGRFFCAMIFREERGVYRADVVHDCGDDRYEGEATMTGMNEWRLVWNVLGPRKDYTLDTAYSRIVGEKADGRSRPYASPTRP